MEQGCLRRLLLTFVGIVLFVLGYWLVGLANLVGAHLGLVPDNTPLSVDAPWGAPLNALGVVSVVGAGIVLLLLRRMKGR